MMEDPTVIETFKSMKCDMECLWYNVQIKKQGENKHLSFDINICGRLFC